METDYEDLPSFRVPPAARVNKTYGKASARRLHSQPRPPPQPAAQSYVTQGLDANEGQENAGSRSRPLKRNRSQQESEQEEPTRSEPKRKVSVVGRKRGKQHWLPAEGGVKVKRRKGVNTISDIEHGATEGSDVDQVAFVSVARLDSCS